MSTLKIVSFVIKLHLNIALLHHFTDVSRPDRLSSAELASIAQAAGLQGTYYPHR